MSDEVPMSVRTYYIYPDNDCKPGYRAELQKGSNGEWCKTVDVKKLHTYDPTTQVVMDKDDLGRLRGLNEVVRCIVMDDNNHPLVYGHKAIYMKLIQKAYLGKPAGSGASDD